MLLFFANRQQDRKTEERGIEEYWQLKLSWTNKSFYKYCKICHSDFEDFSQVCQPSKKEHLNRLVRQVRALNWNLKRAEKNMYSILGCIKEKMAESLSECRTKGGSRHHLFTAIIFFYGSTKCKQIDVPTFCHTTNAQICCQDIGSDALTCFIMQGLHGFEEPGPVHQGIPR